MKRYKWIMLGLALVLALPVLSPGTADAQGSAKSYIGKLKKSDDWTSIRSRLQQRGATDVEYIPQIGAVRFKVNDPQRSAAAGVLAESYLESKVKLDTQIIEMAQPAALPALTSGGDLYELYQWDIKQVTNDGELWSIPHGTGVSADGQPVVIAVVDSGIDYTHPDLDQNVLYGKSFVDGVDDYGDTFGHGTHVAGAIAANGRVMGVGPDLKLASYRIFGANNEAPVSAMAEAIVTAADDGVDVMNLSLGGYVWKHDPASTVKDQLGSLKLVQEALDYAIAQGVIVVHSTGNEGVQTHNPAKLADALNGAGAHGTGFRIPAHPHAIAVGASDTRNKRAFYSNYGSGVVDVLAPGGDLGERFEQTNDPADMDVTKAAFSTLPGGGYGPNIGTSMAAPKVAALAGLIIAKHGRDVKPQQVKQILKSTATDILKRGTDKESGAGIVNGVAAME